MSGHEKLADMVEQNERLRAEGSRTKHIATILRVKEDGEMDLVNDTELKVIKPANIGLDSGGTLQGINSVQAALLQRSSGAIENPGMDVQISKINIEINPTDYGLQEVVTHGSAAIQVREPVNYSNLTNYHMRNNPVFGDNQGEGDCKSETEEVPSGPQE